MDFVQLADLLFPNVTLTPEDLEAKYPPRELPEGAKVTRFAPSPTGFVHIGGVYQTMVGERLAHQSGGIFYLRIEDTDSKREIEGAAENLIGVLSRYGIAFDEGATIDDGGNVADKGAYGPYRQSDRKEIYHVFAKKLVAEGKAYPCFNTDSEIAELDAVDKKLQAHRERTEESDAAEKAEMLARRNITLEEVKENLARGNRFVLRILADGDPEKKTPFTDLIKGKLEIPENDEDFVLLKNDGIPTYHFAHAVDDHLMRTTHVIRGEEWLPSVAKHIQLFRYLGFRQPKYLHTAQIMQLDENGNKKKLSKRDLGANMNDYERLGYSPRAVCEYLLTILNSNFEEWRTANPNVPYTSFAFNVKKMSASGCLFDRDKLRDVSKNVMASMTAGEVTQGVCDWAKDNDPELYAALSADREYTESVFAIGRGGKKPRKDFALWSEVRDCVSYFFDELFVRRDALPVGCDPNDVKKVLNAYLDAYDPDLDAEGWFDMLKSVVSSLGYASDMKAYKADPSSWAGSISDVSTYVRLAVTGRTNAPDLYTVISVLGKDRALARVKAYVDSL